MSVKLVWITPDADAQIAYMARVSNPNATLDDPSEKLIKYLINHKHWSPFEMANMCVEINTTRDIARQILRHRSFHFQEFSQRYSKVAETPEYSKPRLQDTKNRQNSISVDEDIFSWDETQKVVWVESYRAYEYALECGIAKELARKLLPEGLTRTKMYMNGTIRDWIHYLSIRTGLETQYEHREVAEATKRIFADHLPVVFEAATETGLLKSNNHD